MSEKSINFISFFNEFKKNKKKNIKRIHNRKKGNNNEKVNRY